MFNKQKMNELATVYTKIKKLTTDNLKNVTKQEEVITKIEVEKNIEEDEEHYLIPKKLDLIQTDDFYKMCPAPKPVIVSKSAPCTPLTEDNESPHTFYIEMDKAKQSTTKNDTEVTAVGPDQDQDHNYQNFTLADNRITSSSLPETFPTTSDNNKKEIQAGKSLQSIEMPKTHKKRNKEKHHTSLQSIHSKSSKSSGNINIKEDKVQVELAEIINDFKNNVHTIAQTEQLVAEWQNRNDVQKSFKEKQDQLREMRMRYEQIQRDMKHGGRKSSPFERFKKIFGFSHHHSYQIRDKENIKEVKDIERLNIKQTGTDTRPISSLSLQSTASSASSGTMSTMSGCSLGDSGTHSDHEERKVFRG